MIRKTFLCLALISTKIIFGQIVFVSDNENSADYVVRFVPNKWDAVIRVYQTDRTNDANESDRDGVWYFTNRRNHADFSIYINVHGSNRSLGVQGGNSIGLGSNNTRSVDLKLYLVDNRNQAGFN